MEKITKISNSKYEVEINLEATETKKYIDEAIDKEIKKVKEPGFRSGKMPKSMFLKKYGIESVYPMAIDLIVNEVYPKLVEENKLKVVAAPEFDWTGVKISSEEGFSVKGTVEVLPEFDLPDYEKIKKEIKKEEVKVTKKEIKDEINNLLSKDATYEEKEDYPAANGDIVVIDFEGFVDGKAFEGGKGESYSLTLGSETFIPGFEKQLEGAKNGEKVDVNVSFPENYGMPDLAGKPAVFKCLVHEVKKRTLPKLTAKKIQSLEGYDVTTKEELEKAIEEKIIADKTVRIDNIYASDVLKALVEAINLEIPQGMIAEETNNTIRNLDANFKQQGMGLDMYLQMTGMDLDTLKLQLNVESKTRLESQLLIEKVMEEKEIKVTKKEIDAQTAILVDRYQMSEEELIKQLGGSTDPIKRDLQFEKAKDLLFK